MALMNMNLQGIGEVLTGAGSFAKDIRSAITGDISSEKKAELEMKALEIESALANAQNDVNKIEAGSSNLFVAGWRPAVGWVCTVGLAYACVLKPLIEFIANLFGYVGSFPTVDSNTLNTTLFGMLGLGAMRTYEKVKDSAGRH